MKLLIVAALCVVMVLTSAAALSDEEASDGTVGLIQQEEHNVVKRSTSCPMGWTEDNNRCIFCVSQPRTWAQAQRFCETMNAHLASVHSLGEYQQIQRLIFDATQTSKAAWIGGSDAQQNDYWFWIDGTHFTYENWCTGEPNNRWSVEHCVVINYSEKRRFLSVYISISACIVIIVSVLAFLALTERRCWNDMSCNDQLPLPSVCAKNI